MMTVKEMQNEMVKEFGFENPFTVKFFSLCEKRFTLKHLNGMFHLFQKEARTVED